MDHRAGDGRGAGRQGDAHVDYLARAGTPTELRSVAGVAALAGPVRLRVRFTTVVRLRKQ